MGLREGHEPDQVAQNFELLLKEASRVFERSDQRGNKLLFLSFELLWVCFLQDGEYFERVVLDRQVNEVDVEPYLLVVTEAVVSLKQLVGPSHDEQAEYCLLLVGLSDFLCRLHYGLV